MIGATSLASLPRLRDCTSHRASSYAHDGTNADYWIIRPGKTVTLADVEGPGCIKHIWMTFAAPSDDYTRRIVLRAYWEGCQAPSVECPLGDFFGLGHGKMKNFVTAALQMSPQNGRGFNCWFPMPFQERAVLTVENQGDEPYVQYFYIDYEKYPRPDASLAYLHVQWRRENPTGSWGDEHAGLRDDPEQYNKMLRGGGDKRSINKSGKDNYVVLETKGNGAYVGAHLDIDIFERQKNDWFGEGDDMFFIDGEKWPPSLHGTGTEDWYHCAYSPYEEYNAPYHGVILYSGTPGWKWRGKQTVYRYHVEDPIRFRKSLLFSIEHGHGNKLSNDYSSTAYYYLTRPQRGGPKLPAVETRLPRPDDPPYEGRARSRRRRKK